MFGFNRNDLIYTIVAEGLRIVYYGNIWKRHWRTFCRNMKNMVFQFKTNKSLKEIKSNILSTYNENIIGDFGSFGGELKINLPENSNLVFVDGVGTSSILSRNIRENKGLADWVRVINHCINDILVQRAIPWIFDYLANNLRNN